MNIAKNSALEKLLSVHRAGLATEEGLSEECITEKIALGEMVLLGNPQHAGLKPLLVGQPARVKINANLGTSPLHNCLEEEMEKVRACREAGADTIMDLSTAGDLPRIRAAMLQAWALPLGTVPIYAVGQQLMDNDRQIATMTKDELFNEIARQCEQGVDFITVHCGLTKRGAELALGEKRTLGIVSRGGSMMTRWMLENAAENPLYTDFDRLLEICRPYNVTLSLGDGLRPGAGCDAGDGAQWEEVITLGQLCSYAQEQGVQCMIEGPGHMSLNLVAGQIEGIKRLTKNAPLYVLGPLVCDSTPGYDHIAGAIGAAIGVASGVDFLCYLTPAEHLTLPNCEDVKRGIYASRVAAHAGEVALKTPRAMAREQAMNKARKKLDWQGMAQVAIDPQLVDTRRAAHNTEDVCAMCGKFCSVKMLQNAKVK